MVFHNKIIQIEIRWYNLPFVYTHAMVTNHLRASYGIYFTKKTYVFSAPYGTQLVAGRTVRCLVIFRPRTVPGEVLVLLKFGFEGYLKVNWNRPGTGQCYHIQTPAVAGTTCARAIVKDAGDLQINEIVWRQFNLWPKQKRLFVIIYGYLDFAICTIRYWSNTSNRNFLLSLCTNYPLILWITTHNPRSFFGLHSSLHSVNDRWTLQSSP